MSAKKYLIVRVLFCGKWKIGGPRLWLNRFPVPDEMLKRYVLNDLSKWLHWLFVVKIEEVGNLDEALLYAADRSLQHKLDSIRTTWSIFSNTVAMPAGDIYRQACLDILYLMRVVEGEDKVSEVGKF